MVYNMLHELKALTPDWVKATYHKIEENRYRDRMLELSGRVACYDASRYEAGINLIGNIRSETGLGESMRILARILKENHIPFVVVNVDQWANADNNIHDWDEYIVAEPRYDVNLIHINTDHWMHYYSQFPQEWLDYRYNVAYWLWELEKFPRRWMDCIQTVDAIWAPSQFICDCFAQYTDKPVRHVPYAIWLQEPVSDTRDSFELPEDVYLHLAMYDFRSVSERKNPQAAVDAFKKAFTPEQANEEKIGLVLKVNNAATEQALEQLRKQLSAYQYIYYITENLTRSRVESLMADVDVLLSLHRSEGFGLPIAESMYLGTPVVATNWSANAEFMDAASACTVGGNFVTITKQLGPYEKGNRWMDANVDEAADYLKRLYQDREYYEKIREGGRKQIRQTLNYRNAGRTIQKEMELIRA